MKKDKLFTMKLSSVELESYKTQARNNGVTLAHLINSKMQDTPIKTANKELLFELNKIGNNLNQIAKSLHTGAQINVLQELIKIEQHLKELLNAHKGD